MRLNLGKWFGPAADTTFAPGAVGAYVLSSTTLESSPTVASVPHWTLASGDRTRPWPPPGTVLPDVTGCPHNPRLLALISDSSGSVTAYRGNDAAGRRWDEQARAVEVWAGKCRCDDQLVAVLHFDDVGADVGPIPTRPNRQAMAALEPALQIPAGAGSSNQGSSADRTLRMGREHPKHELVAVTFTDGQLFDSNPQAVIDGLAAGSSRLHRVILGGHSHVNFDAGNASYTDLNEQSDPGAAAAAIINTLNEVGSKPPRKPAKAAKPAKNPKKAS